MAYIFDSTWSYSDYLQARDFLNQGKAAVREASDRGARTVSMTISRETRRLIASQETLAREGFQLQRETEQAQLEAQREMNTTLKEGFECLSYELAEISDGISELNATFHWGFSQMIAQMGRMNDTLDQLHAIAKTPVQTVAFNHFEIARDAYRQGLYAETIEELDKAIGGDHTSPGYKLEWRFHHLRGVVRLGSFESGPAPVNLPEAEESFLAAARYAQKDYQPEAARALLSAGWAAYCQGKMPEALAHTEQAMQLDEGLNEALFQASKVHMAMGQPQKALPLLGKLVKAQAFYAIKAAGDGDFQRYEAALRAFLEALRQEKQEQVAAAARHILKHTEGKRLCGDTDGSMTKRLMEVVQGTAAMPLIDLVEAEKCLTTSGGCLLVLHDIVERVSTQVEEHTIEHFTERVLVRPPVWFRNAVYRDEARTRPVVRMSTVNQTAAVERLEGIELTSGAVRFRVDLVGIPAGSFLMGNAKVTNEEMPLHNVTISKGFQLGKYPVTQAQWQAVMGNNPSFFKGDDRPVEHVSWDDCQEFIGKLNALGHGNFRLPSEAEWEYACRAGRTTEYCFGNDENQIEDYAWYRKNSLDGTKPVGQKKPNAWGLYDMHGNVWEWCQDSYHDSYTGAPTDGSAWERPGGESRVIRGGSYNDVTRYARSVRAASRSNMAPMDRYAGIGFRLARTI